MFGLGREQADSACKAATRLHHRLLGDMKSLYCAREKEYIQDHQRYIGE